ncbi:CAP domain-containing protein, partial [Neohortaea acidophila]
NYIPTLLKQHNIHRANHSAADVVWNSTLADIATQIAQSCTFAHQSIDGGGYGQNIAAGVPASNIAAVVTNLWYDGEFNSFLPSYYGQANPPNFYAWGHFSQVVWKATSEIGCGTVYCSKGLGGVGSDVPPWFTVCNYRGPGNVGGLYGKNIGKPLGHPNV